SQLDQNRFEMLLHAKSAVIGPDGDGLRRGRRGHLIFAHLDDFHATLGRRVARRIRQDRAEGDLQLSRRRYILVSDHATHESAAVTNFVVTIVMKLPRLLLLLAAAAALTAHPLR